MTNRKPDISDSLIKTLGDSEAMKIIPDMADIGVDLLTQSEVLKEVPFFGHLFSLWKGGTAVRDYFFMKKICSFLLESKSINETVRQEFIEKAKVDSKFSKETGEHIINLLDRFDQLSKAAAFAKIFVAYLEHKISYKEYMSFSYALDKINFEHIDILKDYYKQELNYKFKAFLQPFAFVGLVSISTPNERQKIQGFNQNTFGQRFLAVLGFEDFKNVLSQRHFVDCGEGVSEFGSGAILCIIDPSSYLKSNPSSE